MARTSKKRQAAVPVKKEKIYSVGIYVRLSVGLSGAEDKVRELSRMKVHESFAVTKLTAELLDEYVEDIRVFQFYQVKYF